MCRGVCVHKAVCTGWVSAGVCVCTGCVYRLYCRGVCMQGCVFVYRRHAGMCTGVYVCIRT